MKRGLTIAGIALMVALAVGAVAWRPVAGWSLNSTEQVVAPAALTPAEAQQPVLMARASPRVVTRTYYTTTYTKRPLKKSVAIVAGGAGAGAAIGAIAGGGKGAAIGALSGGTAAFIYDRLTHKKKVQ